MKTKAKPFDCIQSFMFTESPVRGHIVHLEKTLKTILNQQVYPRDVQRLLTETLIACVLLTKSIKFEGEITVQFQGDDRLPLLIAQCTHDLNIRGYAQFNHDPNIDYHEAFIKGTMVVTIQHSQQAKAYQSVIPISSIHLADNLMQYFGQSEQIPSFVMFAHNAHLGAGIMLQQMPSEKSVEREQFWEYATHISHTLTANELLQLTNQTLLHRLFHETEIRLFDSKAVTFACRCNPLRMQRILSILGEKESLHLLHEQGHIGVTCEFCNQPYRFDAIDVAQFFKENNQLSN